MTRKRKPKLSPEARNALKLGSKMLAEVLERGGLPEIIIAAKPGPGKFQIDYFIASALDEDDVKYVLSRVVGLLDGSIQRNN